MIGSSAVRGLCPCDPRIYRFAASPVQGLRFATTPEASAARLRRVRPPESALGSHTCVALSSVRSRSVYDNRGRAEAKICCANVRPSAKKDLFLSAPVGRF